MRFSGSYTALITPFKGKEVDYDALEKLIEMQIAGGTHGLVACGTTAESPTLDHAEHEAIVEFCIKKVKGRVPVIAGTGSNATNKTVDMTLFAQKAGADAALIVTPYYNKPTQEGLYQHYMSIANMTDIPIILYDVPGRCVVSLKVETIARLSEHPRIIGIKDATGDLSRVKAIREACGDDFIQLSGEDAIIARYLQEGGHGCISVTSNIAPGFCAALHNAWKNGDNQTVAKIDEQLQPLHSAMFCETSPAPAKYAASRLGITNDHVRLPLVAASNEARKQVDDAMKGLGLHSSADASILRAHG
jgi:4-hydroxy-tetrahydrodipicolinate synthase